MSICYASVNIANTSSGPESSRSGPHANVDLHVTTQCWDVVNGYNSRFKGDENLYQCWCYDQRSIGQSVLVSSNHLRPKTVTVKQLRVCWCRAPSLRIGQVCRIQLLLVLASADILGSKSLGTHDHILLSQIPGPPIYMRQETCGPVIPPGTGFSFRRLLRLAGLRWRHTNQPLTRD
jgi:hypothetical protein